MQVIETFNLCFVSGGTNANGNNGNASGQAPMGLSTACSIVGAVSGLAVGGIMIASGVAAPGSALGGFAAGTAMTGLCNTVAGIATQNPSVSMGGGSGSGSGSGGGADGDGGGLGYEEIHVEYK